MLKTYRQTLPTRDPAISLQLGKRLEARFGVIRAAMLALGVKLGIFLVQLSGDSFPRGRTAGGIWAAVASLDKSALLSGPVLCQ